MEITLALRPYDRSALEPLLEIERDAGEGAWTRAQLLAHIRRPATFCRVIETTGDTAVPVGFFVLERRPDTIYIANIAVAAERRRQGVASWGLERIEEIARGRGVRRVALDVQENNLSAQLLYRKAGYRAVSIRRGFYGSQDGYHMRKELAGP